MQAREMVQANDPSPGEFPIHTHSLYPIQSKDPADAVLTFLGRVDDKQWCPDACKRPSASHIFCWCLQSCVVEVLKY